MIIGGLQKFSLLDYPEHLSAIVFTLGCNFRCQFCYNPMLVLPKEVGKMNDISSPENGGEIKEGYPRISTEAFFDFLSSRTGKLDAVVITGGEPTLQVDLPEFIAQIRSLGYKVKVDTNGTNPSMINQLLRQKAVDYLAMDLKASLDKYDLVAGVQPDLTRLKRSIGLIMDSGLPYEFRTTVVPELIEETDIHAMASLLKGAEKWYLQRFRSDIDLINSSFQGLPGHPEQSLEKMRQIALEYVKYCEIR